MVALTTTSPTTPRRGRPPVPPATLAARRARLIFELGRPTPDFDGAAAALGLSRGSILRLLRQIAPDRSPRIGRPRSVSAAPVGRWAADSRETRLARLRAELLQPAPNLKAVAFELGITLSLAGLMVRRDLGYRTFYVSAAEREILLAARRAAAPA